MAMARLWLLFCFLGLVAHHVDASDARDGDPVIEILAATARGLATPQAICDRATSLVNKPAQPKPEVEQEKVKALQQALCNSKPATLKQQFADVKQAYDAAKDVSHDTWKAFIRSLPAFAQHIPNEIKEVLLRKNEGGLEDRMRKTHFYIPRELTERDVFSKFIQWKLESGTETEREYYRSLGNEWRKATYQGEQKFISELIRKRARSFLNKQDLTLLRKEHSDILMWMPWHYIGDDTWESAVRTFKNYGDDSGRAKLLGMWSEYAEKWGKATPLHYGKYDMAEKAKSFPFEYFSIYDYLSYDEMQLAALLIAAGPAKFRSNCQVEYYKKEDSEFVSDGYIVGVVGARCDKYDVMDFSLMVEDRPKDKKLREIIYGLKEDYKPVRPALAWKDPVFGGFTNKDKVLLSDDDLRRLNLDIKPQVIEAHGQTKTVNAIMVPIDGNLYNERLKITFGAYFDFVHQTMTEVRSAAAASEKAYVMILAIGGGLWAIDAAAQSKWIAPAIEEVLADGVAKRGYSDTIATVHCVPDTLCQPHKIGTIDITNDKISGVTGKAAGGRDKNTIRFWMYPWDSNSYPGNELWIPTAKNWPKAPDDLFTIWQMSGDPGAALCSDIVFTQNQCNNKHLADVGDAKNLYKHRIRKGDHVCVRDEKGDSVQRGFVADNILYHFKDSTRRLVVGKLFNKGTPGIPNDHCWSRYPGTRFGECGLVDERDLAPCKCTEHCAEYELASKDTKWLYSWEASARSWAADNKVTDRYKPQFEALLRG